ncbi:hemoglobin subunit alpha-A [Solea senegalensis]|uniref:Hemoglobin subunit alpha-A n=1 Tax=Solea senegalensis TaxID=28829 RepID=A0AAV6RJ18_SOLSE|nr:hemoglobin subunit alpha-A-like [Solea senegalensis]KAG7504270.1 hemoglobin subunit alpha-A [Solea senegalensis]
MSLTGKDKAVVSNLWGKIALNSDLIGAEALGRMLTASPQTKTYFSHWSDLSPTSEQVKKHGAVILKAIGEAVEGIDDLKLNLSRLSELHAFKLQVDPNNFKILSHSIQLVIAMYYPKDFTPEVQVSVDKFLQNVALALSEKYR